MNQVESVQESENITFDKNRNQAYDQLMGILRKKIGWNQIFSETTSMVGGLHGRVKKFTEKQTEYMEVVNILLDSILSGELKVYLPLFTGMQDKYKVVEENISNFKIKLTQATEEVEKGRMEWLDGFLPSQPDFIVKFSAEERKASVNRCQEGDRAAIRTKLMLHDLTRKWSALELDMENRLTEFIRGVEDLLGNNLDNARMFKKYNTLSENWMGRVGKILRHKALKSIREKAIGGKMSKSSSANSNKK